MGDILGSLWDLLTPSLGGSALAAAGIGVLAGLIRHMIARFGIVKALLALIGFAVALLWLRCIPRPAQVEAQPVAVKKAGSPQIQPKPRPHRRRRYIQYPGF